MPRNETIKNLVEIQIGYQLRQKPKADDDGKILLIQLKDINTSRTQLEFTEETLRFDPKRSIERQLLEEGDVLFMGKGSKPFACVVRNLPAPAVATGMFFILRPKMKRILPEYLAWVLNSKRTLDTLMIASGTGVAMPVIRRTELEKVSIPLPPLETQKKIGELQELNRQEMDLINQLSEQRQILTEGICRSLMENF
ncbi:MAG: restriction endonuclease subunit S [Kiritimatiellae bacterium]|nr:restriction endonuclease subunit S [Kiritimatiellia bacterium]MDD4734603.1 restriction endonuclease subunit S [Kiritimatiellia bacterium]